VTDGLWRKSLSAIRSLGKAGWDVTVAGDTLFTTGFWSRYAGARLRGPLAARDGVGFGRMMVRWLSENAPRRPVVLPMEDATLRWVSENRDGVLRFADALLPPAEALRIAWDKGETAAVASQLGLGVPQTSLPTTANALWEMVRDAEPGQFVIKPAAGSGSAGVQYAKPRSFDDVYRHWKRYGRLLVQTRVPAEGRARGVSLLFGRDGACLAAFAHERLRQYPVSGGPSTDRVSVRDDRLVADSIRLLQALRWQGVAMVEWKLDPSDGNRPKLMEINPRFWGSLELAIRAGVDFPVLYAAAARGEPVAPAFDYTEGVRCRWMVPGELLRYATERREDREPLAAFLAGLPGDAEEWDVEDLRGSVASIACTAAGALNPRHWKHLRRG
jgi:predicted ATP-grasp superfamily ATP-dependent carboligase